MGVDLEALKQQARKHSYLLLLMRHAQALSAGQGDDRLRPLSPCGLRQAATMGKMLTRMSMLPDRIVCSGATRTRQTLDQMLEPFGDKPKVEYKESLYTEGTQAIFDELAASKLDEHILLIVAHEPVVSMIAQLLADENGDQNSLSLLGLGIAPANVAILGSDAPFNSWQLHHAECVGILSPKNS
jgi:phosphohistidine phosphatase